MDRQIVKLNVGGHRVDTFLSTLSPHGKENFFTALLAGRIGSVLDDEGAYFIDRDGEAFAWIMRCLREGKRVEIPSSLNSAVRREAAFYLLDLEKIFGDEAAASVMKDAVEGVYFYDFGSQPPQHYEGSAMIVRVGSEIYRSPDRIPEHAGQSYFYARGDREITRQKVLEWVWKNSFSIKSETNGVLESTFGPLNVVQDGLSLDFRGTRYIFREAILLTGLTFDILGCKIAFENPCAPTFTATQKFSWYRPCGTRQSQDCLYSGNIERTEDGLFCFDVPALFLNHYMFCVVENRYQKPGPAFMLSDNPPSDQPYFECPARDLEPSRWRFRVKFTSAGRHLLLVSLQLVEFDGEELVRRVRLKGFNKRQRHDTADLVLEEGDITKIALFQLSGLWAKLTGIRTPLILGKAN